MPGWLQRWLAWPLQLHTSTRVPLAVVVALDVEAQAGLDGCDAAVGVRPELLVGLSGAGPDGQRGAGRDTCYVQASGLVEGTQLPWLVKTQPWFCCPLQSQIVTGVPAAGLLPDTSRQRPDAALTSGSTDRGYAVPAPSHVMPPLAATMAAASTIFSIA